MEKRKQSNLDKDALAMHRSGRPGKVEVVPTKPLTTQRDLALAYSPGVAAPCLEIAQDPSTAYEYTAKEIWWRLYQMAPQCSGSGT